MRDPMLMTPSALRAARLAAGLSAEQLAVRAGVSVAWLLTCERAPGLASEALLARLAMALGLAPTAFAFGIAPKDGER